jgi:glycolate oxidase subunit GlcD
LSQGVVSAGLARDLARIVGDAGVIDPGTRPYGEDATRDTMGISGMPDAVVLPGSPEEVRDLVAWCYEQELPIVPRGGGTGYAGGAVPFEGGIVVSMERLRAVRSLEGAYWRGEVEAGVTTGNVARLARESGLLFPPNPGAAEQSQIGGNVATNAGGPRAFKYGVTGRWVMGLEAVVAPGELIRVGGPLRKDVAGYDLRSLLIGSEGTLGIITSVWLSFVPAPEVSVPLAFVYPDAARGCEAIEQVIGNGLVPAALEYADEGALAAAADSFPVPLPAEGGFLVLLEVDGSQVEAARIRAEALELLSDGATALFAPEEPAEIRALWRWRDGMSAAVTSVTGAKYSEDVSVPIDRLAEVIAGVISIGARHGLQSCSWGHAGDGNIHGSFLMGRDDEPGRQAASEAAADLSALAVDLCGSESGEHGVGWIKRGRLEAQLGSEGLRLHLAVKQAFDPKNLLNPGKKT